LDTDFSNWRFKVDQDFRPIWFNVVEAEVAVREKLKSFLTLRGMKFKSKLKVGCRVKVTNLDENKTGAGSITLNKIGTIKDIFYHTEKLNWGLIISVGFDENIGGHSCNQMCEYGHGQNMNESDLKRLTKKDL